MTATPQQLLLIGHDHTRHGRSIAGPGTGKSWTAIELLRRIHAHHPELHVGLVTFTRAASSELIKKAGAQGLDWLEPSTIHAYALRLIMAAAGAGGVALPLRIPDSWENKNLVRKDLARRLRGAGHNVNVSKVEQLEREMAGQWESLDPDYVLLASIDPALRNAYVGQWSAHRRLYEYCLLAEIPFRAGHLLEDHDPDIGNLAFLVVDEYQDLNRADIRLLRLLSVRGVRILAIGDDDQSIYGFRMAAPVGIAEFPVTFATNADYPLTVSMRCGAGILDPATTLIETAPARVTRPRLAPRVGLADGDFAYLRFADQAVEANGIARLIAWRIQAGVAPKDIAVLVRSSVDTWSALIAPELDALGIPVVNTDWVKRALNDSTLRTALATARIAVTRTDSLAWWTHLTLAGGVSEAFVRYVAGSAGPTESFGDCLLRLAPGFVGAPSTQSARAAAQLVQEQLAAVASLETAGEPDDVAGWGSWLKNRVVAGALSEEAERLLDVVGREVPVKEGLAGFLGKLEPVGKDLALQADAVRIMSMSSSKGLTVNSAFLTGVEAGIVPHPHGTLDEERRLLYVAMTRATELCVLTAAKRRTGPTARHGIPNVNQPRGRSPLLAELSIGEWQNGSAYLEALGC